MCPPPVRPKPCLEGMNGESLGTTYMSNKFYSIHVKGNRRVRNALPLFFLRPHRWIVPCRLTLSPCPAPSPPEGSVRA